MVADCADRGSLRAAARMLMLLFAQATAVTLVFVLVNNANNLYDTWDDLLGTGTHVQQAADLGADGTGGIALDRLPKVEQKFTQADGAAMHAAGGVRVTQLQGRVSGVNAEVYVWLPPQYNEPAYAHRAFPVVELLPGYPGSAKSWFGSLHVHEQLAPLMREGKVAPFILVAPRTTLLPGVDTGCANVAGHRQRRQLAQHRRAEDGHGQLPGPARAQGLGGGRVLGGGHCATKLAVAHPDRYRAAVSLSGYNDPIGRAQLPRRAGPGRCAGRTTRTCCCGKAAVPPAVALYLSGQPHDGYEAALALRQEAKAPTTVHVVYVPTQARADTPWRCGGRRWCRRSAG